MPVRSSAPRISAAERKRFMSGKVSEIRGKKQSEITTKGGRRHETEEDREFKNTLREVLDYVTPQLGKHERKQYEEAKLRALGGTIEKREKVPYSKLQKD